MRSFSLFAIGSPSVKPSAEVSANCGNPTQSRLHGFSTNYRAADFTPNDVRVEKCRGSLLRTIKLSARKHFATYRALLVSVRRFISAVKRLVLADQSQFKIARIVVKPVAVFVMYLFALAKSTAKYFLHYMAVLKYFLAFPKHKDAIAERADVTFEHSLTIPCFCRNSIYSTTILCHRQ